MSNFTRLLAGAAALAGIAAPAAAQYTYPQTAYPYPQQGYAYPQQGYTYPQQGYAYPQSQYGYTYPQSQYGYTYPQQQYGYQNQGVIGSIISQLLGNRYSVTDRTAVTQCASAAMTQAAYQYRGNGYNQGYGYNGYNQYSQASGNGARITAITDVRRSSYGLRVKGLMNSGMAYAYGNQRYNPAYNTVSDLSFRCDVDYRGAVTNVRLERANNYYRR